MSLIAAVVGSVALALGLAALRRVPDGQVHTVHRFGRYVRALPPGLHLVWPGLDRVAQRVLLIGHHLQLPASEFGQCRAGGDLYYQILDPTRTGDALERVDSLVLGEAQALLAEVANEGASPAPAVSAEALKRALNERIDKLGLRVTRFSLHAG